MLPAPAIATPAEGDEGNADDPGDEPPAQATWRIIDVYGVEPLGQLQRRRLLG